ncbi:rab-GTPase-TBC domain-containing protein [Zychaea mexicana]|uniref:rab-GTPase-TBC domain-containing protein n=1 Tax=Zychaea mexicana TaxID=64656 RepID=UPI0022FE8163|nr:rab-GTPase-TBC domain-containing protein [Zychaea mexicana]KAI9469333.1 rab-GTPase-TBC domain-containing protein [Zychaea mexicana]
MPAKRKRTKRPATTKKKDNHCKTAAVDGEWKVRNVAALRAMGRSPGGFVNDDMRRKIWPLLLYCDRLPEKSNDSSRSDESQVELDILRSFNTYPHDISDERKQNLRTQLTGVITHVLRSHPKLHYYQGFHDIASIFLLLFGEKEAGVLMQQVSLFFIRDAMLDSLDPILREITMIDTIVQHEDPTLHMHMTEAGVLPYYCLSWVITWFSHDIDDVSKIVRLFDLFLSSNPLMPLYVSAALVLARRKLVLSQPADPSMIHTLLTKVPRNVNVEMLIKRAIELERAYPPHELQQLSGVGLDQESCVNTHKELWLDMALLNKDSSEKLEAMRHKAEEILSMSGEERTPIPIDPKRAMAAASSKPGHYYGRKLLGRMREMYAQDPMLWTTVLLSAGVVTFAMATDQLGLVREWLSSI